MIFSWALFISLLCVLLLLARKAERSDERKYVIWIIILLAVFAGLRGSTVGKDTEKYISLFSLIKNKQFHLAYGLEEAFKRICYILLSIWNNPNFLFSIFALITNGLVVFRLWSFRKISSFPWTIATYYVFFYFLTFNIMRQMCAAAIIFWATKFLYKRKYFYFILFVAGGFLFHRTALLGVGFLAVELIEWKNIIQKQKIFFVVTIPFIPLMVFILIKESAHYSQYFSAISTDIGLMLPVKLLLLIIATVTFWPMIRKAPNSVSAVKQTPSARLDYLVRTTELYYFFGILLSGIGYLFPFMDRIGIPYYLFECVLFGVLTKKRHNKNYLIFCGVVIGLLSYSYIAKLISNGQGVFPYVFAWQ